MHLVWLIAAAVSTGSPLASPRSMVRAFVAQADDAPPADKPKKKKKKKADSDLESDTGSDKNKLITDVGDPSAPKNDEEAGSKTHPIQMAEGTEKVILVPGLASAEAYDELAAEVAVHGDELHLKALSAGRTNLQATLKDGTFKTWVIEVLAATPPAKPASPPPATTVP